MSEQRVFEQTMPELNLRVPGPTPLPPTVREALSRQMVNHRSSDFEPIMREVHEHLQYFFATENPILTFPASGTGGMEAAIVNLFSPDDEVVAVTIGSFGERFAEIAGAYGLRVHRLDYAWREAARPEDVVRALEEAPGARGLLLTQNETSTGVLNPLESLVRAARAARPDLLIVVDGISGLGAAPLFADAWDLDVVITGSQKSWMSPPGMTMLSVGPRAWEAALGARLPRFYFDFVAARRGFDDANPPYTPAISLYFALQVALRSMREEGRERIWARHEQIAAYTREGARRLGLDLLADPDHYSPSVTAIVVPPNLSEAALIKSARERHGVVFAGGQKGLSGKIIRIGHLGLVDEAAIDDALSALADALAEQGWTPPAST